MEVIEITSKGFGNKNKQPIRVHFILSADELIIHLVTDSSPFRSFFNVISELISVKNFMDRFMKPQIMGFVQNLDLFLAESPWNGLVATG